MYHTLLIMRNEYEYRFISFCISFMSWSKHPILLALIWKEIIYYWEVFFITLNLISSITDRIIVLSFFSHRMVSAKMSSKIIMSFFINKLSLMVNDSTIFAHSFWGFMLANTLLTYDIYNYRLTYIIMFHHWCFYLLLENPSRQRWHFLV